MLEGGGELVGALACGVALLHQALDLLAHLALAFRLLLAALLEGLAELGDVVLQRVQNLAYALAAGLGEFLLARLEHLGGIGLDLRADLRNRLVETLLQSLQRGVGALLLRLQRRVRPLLERLERSVGCPPLLLALLGQPLVGLHLPLLQALFVILPRRRRLSGYLGLLLLHSILSLLSGGREACLRLGLLLCEMPLGFLFLLREPGFRLGLLLREMPLGVLFLLCEPDLQQALPGVCDKPRRNSRDDQPRREGNNDKNVIHNVTNIMILL